MSRALRHLRSNLIAWLALFAALGGSAYAAAKIGAGDIRRDAVRAKHIKRHAVKAGHLGRSQRTVWAHVEALPDSEQVVEGSSGVTVAGSPGTYHVDFGRKVSGRALVASLAGTDDAVISASLCGASGDEIHSFCGEEISDGPTPEHFAEVEITDVFAGFTGPASRDFYIAALPR